MKHTERRHLHETKRACRQQTEEGAVLTVHDDLDYPEVDFSPGHDTSLAGVHALIGLLDAADLQVAVILHPESH